MVLGTVLGVIFVGIFWKTIMDSCIDDTGFFERYFKIDTTDVDECQTYLKTIIWGIFGFIAIIAIPFCFLICRLVYYGWKQQEYI